jgi:hypothetical protein
VNQLEVRADKLTLVLVILLGLFFVPMGLALLTSAGIARAAIGLVCLMLFGVVVWLVRRGHKKSVRRFSAEGLVRNDGQSFAWPELCRVVDRVRVRNGRKYLWRTEIQFNNGASAWLIPSKIRNYGEVAALVRGLPCEHTEVTA